MKKIQEINYHPFHQMWLIFILVAMVIVGQQMNMERFVMNLILGLVALWSEKAVLIDIYHNIQNKRKVTK